MLISLSGQPNPLRFIKSPPSTHTSSVIPHTGRYAASGNVVVGEEGGVVCKDLSP